MYACTSGATNGRGQKRDNTKQTTLFGLPAVSAAERPEKRSRKKGAAVPSEDSCVTGPETNESQDVEMAAPQDVNTPTSQEATATVVDSQQESQATEVITTQVEHIPYLNWNLKLTTTLRRTAVLSLLSGLQRRHRWKIASQMRYVLAECRTALTDSFIMFPSTVTLCHAFIR